MAAPAIGARSQPAPPASQSAEVVYTLTFPEPEHRWMQVEAVFPGVPSGTFSLRMSTTSPGRYARHEFAKNVYSVRLFDGAGREVPYERPNAHQWDVGDHDGTVRMIYRVFGDRVDGTYLGIDSTHAHLNMPATLVWARGFEARPARVRFDPPPGRAWRVATQLYPTGDPLVFTAPNRSYLMDSPAEFSDLTVRTFEVSDPSNPSTRPAFRVALHHDGAAPDVDAFVAGVERIVRETVAIFGEFPEFETNTYTFIGDYLPYAGSDAMEHRNSTVLAAPAAIEDPRQRIRMLDSVAHEFFHAWNVERIRPRSLEPFNLEEAPVSGELWLAEGFTNYYGALVTQRCGLSRLTDTLGTFGGAINVVTSSPGRTLRSAVEMSELAPFTDAAATVDRTNWSNTFISYYTWGEAIGLGLDLSLRVRSAGEVSLDDYMRALWRTYGKPGGPAPGLVGVPYTVDDARRTLAEVAGGESFAQEFFERYIEGHEVIDYAALLAHAGLTLRRASPGRAWLGGVALAFGSSGARVSAPVPFASPLYQAGIERDDLLVSVAGERLTSPSELAQALSNRQPGERIEIRYMRRGEPIDATAVLWEDPTLELVADEALGRPLTPDERAFRDAWLGARSR